MPTQEERLTIVEQSVTILQKGMRDINHNSTILLGVVSEQGKDIREIKARLVDMSERLDIFEQSTNAHFEMQGKQIEANTKQIEANTKLLAEHSEILADHGAKLDQILLILNKLVSRLDQGQA